MSRKLNLHLPTSADCIVHRKNSETLDRSSAKRSPSANSFSSMQEKLLKTSQIFTSLGLASPKNSSSLLEDQTKELQTLRTKIELLEKEKTISIANRNSIDQKIHSTNTSLNPSITSLKQSITSKIKNRPEFEEAWQRKFPNEQQFNEKIQKEEYSSLLLKTLEFIDEVLQERKVLKIHSLKTSMSIRKEKIANIYQQLSDCIKSTKACTSALGYSRNVSCNISDNEC